MRAASCDPTITPNELSVAVAQSSDQTSCLHRDASAATRNKPNCQLLVVVVVVSIVVVVVVVFELTTYAAIATPTIASCLIIV